MGSLWEFMGFLRVLLFLFNFIGIYFYNFMKFNGSS